jgi:hypothetical protein
MPIVTISTALRAIQKKNKAAVRGRLRLFCIELYFFDKNVQTCMRVVLCQTKKGFPSLFALSPSPARGGLNACPTRYHNRYGPRSLVHSFAKAIDRAVRQDQRIIRRDTRLLGCGLGDTPPSATLNLLAR